MHYLLLKKFLAVISKLIINKIVIQIFFFFALKIKDQ